MTSPIIIFNPSGLTEDQVKQVKDALDAAYRAGYETAKEFYQFKLNTETTKPYVGGGPLTLPGQGSQFVVTPCSHGVEQGIYASANSINCDHSYVNAENKAKGICGKCGISFDEWHG